MDAGRGGRVRVLVTGGSGTIGSYVLRETVPGGYVETSRATNSYSITIAAGQNLTGYTFGNFPITFSGAGPINTYYIELASGGTTEQIWLSNAVGGVKLVVAAADAQLAKEILEGAGLANR